MGVVCILLASAEASLNWSVSPIAYNKQADGSEQAGSINMYICLYPHIHIYYSETHIVVSHDIKFQNKTLEAEVFF